MQKSFLKDCGYQVGFSVVDPDSGTAVYGYSVQLRILHYEL